MIKDWIIKSNDWYDDLKENKRTLFFLGVIFLPSLLIVIIQSIFNIWYLLVIWIVLLSFWRITRLFL